MEHVDERWTKCLENGDATSPVENRCEESDKALSLLDFPSDSEAPSAPCPKLHQDRPSESSMINMPSYQHRYSHYEDGPVSRQYYLAYNGNSDTWKDDLDIKSPSVPFTIPSESGNGRYTTYGGGLMPQNSVSAYLHTGHYRIKPLGCKVTRSEQSKDSLIKHSRIHTGELSHKCRVCLQTFHRVKNQLFTYLYISGNEKPYGCPRCGDEFRDKGSVVKHISEKPSVCTFCQKWGKHSDYFCNQVADKLSHCPGYKEKFSDRTTIATRPRKHPTVCRNPLGSGTSRYVYKDRRIQTKKKLIECMACGKYFERMSDLMTHLLNTHSDMNSFECKICRQSFPNVSSLRLHISNHTDEKLYQQSQKPIGENSHQSNHAHETRHQTNHTPYSSYQCKVCKEHFVMKSTFLKHNERLCKGKAYECSVCGKQFSTNQALIWHIRSHKSNEKLLQLLAQTKETTCPERGNP